MVSAVISLAIAALILLFDKPLLTLLFGKVEPDVMEACEVYIRITTLSASCTCNLRCRGSLVPEHWENKCDNVYFNICRILSTSLGTVSAFRAAYGSCGRCMPVASVESDIRGCGGLVLLPMRTNFIPLGGYFYMGRRILKKVMGIAVPNGIENGVHQLVKVALSSMVALFGTMQIAANGVAQSIWSLASLMGLAMAPAYTTVIGQCMGAGDIESADAYFKRLDKITLILSFCGTHLYLPHTAYAAFLCNLSG